MTAQVVLGTMPHHPFPSAFASPLATPSPTKEHHFPTLSSFTRQATTAAPAAATSEAGPSQVAPSTSDASPDKPFPGVAAGTIDSSASRTYRVPEPRRSSRPRLRSLQSLNSTPASPSLTEQDSGHALISTSRSHTSHPSLGRAPSRNAVESLQPLAESSVAAHTTKPERPSTRSPTSASTPWPTGHTDAGAPPPRPRRSSTSPKLDSGLSEFGQMGAPFAAHGRSEGFLRRSHTVTTGIHSAGQRRGEEASAHRSPPSNAVTYGPSSGRHAPKLTQRRQTVSNVSPSSLERATPAHLGGVSPVPSRTLSYASHPPHAAHAAGSGISVASPPSRLRERGTLPNNQLEAKVVILGSQGVGKTSLVHRYTSGEFSLASTPSTIGASFLTKKLIVEGVRVRLQLWDTAGQERFRSMAPMYYRGSHAAVIVYDLTSMASFLDVRAWIEELKSNMTSDLVIHVVGAKLDLARERRQVQLEFARATVRSWLQPYQTQALALPGVGAAADSDGSPGSPTRPSSRLSGLGSLAIGSASRLASFQRPSPGWTGGAGAGLKPSSFGSSAASSGSAGSDPGRDAAPDLETLSLSWDVVELSEVSAKDDRGIEEVFLALTKKLVERRSQIELERATRERNSIFLSAHDADHLLPSVQPAITPNSWTCCG